MKKVVMIAPYFVPRRRVGALRPFRFAARLQRYGWKPVVVTIRDEGSELSLREQNLLNDVDIIEVAPPFDRTTPKSADTKSKPAAKSSSITADFIDKHFPVDTWLPLFWVSYQKILKQVREHSPDLVWSTGDPWSAHWMGQKLSNELILPWIADFRDPWTLADIDLRERSYFSSEFDKKMEKRVVDKTDKLVFTSARTEALYKDHFNLDSEKTAVIYNSFDDLMVIETQQTEQDLNIDSNCINLFFFGKFRRLSPVTPVIEMLENICSFDKQLISSIRIHSFGMADVDQLNEIKEKGFESNFKFHEPVLPEQTLEVLKQADLLLLSTNKVRSNIIPAKLWDYLAAGKPVLSIAPNPEISDILRESGSGKQFMVDEGKQISDFIRNHVKNNVGNTPTDQTGKKIYSSDAATEKLAKIMDQLTQNG